MTTRSRAKLTEEESEFYKLLLMRATFPGKGQPYIAPALFRLVPVSAPGLGTMAVDRKWRVYIDFEFMREKGVVYAAGVLAHEPWHLLRGHEARGEMVGLNLRDQREQKMWNIAGDLEINDDIKSLIPADSIFPGVDTFAKYPEGKTMEEYLRLLRKDPETVDKFIPPKPECSCDDKKDKGKGQDKGQDSGSQGQDKKSDGGSDSGSGSGDQPGESDQSGQGSQSGSGSGDQPGDGGKGNCPVHSGKKVVGCGSGAGFELGDYELGDGEADGVDSTEADIIKGQIAEEIRNQEKSNPGKMPGWMMEWAGEILGHKPVDWRRALAGVMKAAIAWKRGQTDYVRSRPARRQPIKGAILPALRSPKPNIVVGIDTSGSNLHNLADIVDEIVNISKSVGVRGQELRAFAVDVNPDKIKPVNNPQDVLKDRRLGGGTDMRVAYEVMARLNPKAAIGILLTDGETPWSATAPAKSGHMKFITVLVLAKGSSYNVRTIAEAEKTVGKWSKIIVVEVGDN